jgi:predicted DNA-binding transcriptional regulator AlpA
MAPAVDYSTLRLDKNTCQWVVDDPLTGRPVSDPMVEAMLAAVLRDHGKAPSPVQSRAQRPPPPPAMTLPAAAQTILEIDPRPSREQAAAFLNISSSTLADWATRAKGPRYYDIGASVQYPLSELVEWLARQIKPAAPETEPVPVQRRRGRPRTVPFRSN